MMLFAFHVLSLCGVWWGGRGEGVCVWCVSFYIVAEVDWCVNITQGCETQKGEERGHGWKLKAAMTV